MRTLGVILSGGKSSRSDLTIHKVAFNNGWIDAKTLAKFASTCNNDYGSYLKELIIESEQR